MDLVKDISKSLNFKERYDDLERTGMEEYDRKECKELRELEKSGAPLSQSQKDTLHYCNTIRGERSRAVIQGGVSAAKVGVGLYTGNTALAMQGVTDFGGYVMDEAAEVQGPNDGVGQQLGVEDAQNFGMQALQGVVTGVAGSQGGAEAEEVVDPTTPPKTPSVMDEIAGGNIPEGATAGGTASNQLTPEELQAIRALLANPMLTQGARPATVMPETIGGTEVKINNRGSKLKSTRERSHIKGNTFGFANR
tara:strand:+ start:738 stop:1490 length:753 start_codon:yes stop_codon:yes gene_type:complete